MQTLKDYYLAAMGIDQWILRVPMQRSDDTDFSTQGPVAAALFVVRLISKDNTRWTKTSNDRAFQLLQAMLEGVGYSLSTVRLIQCVDPLSDDSKKPLFSKLSALIAETNPEIIWVLGEKTAVASKLSLLENHGKLIITETLEELLIQPLLKKRVFHGLITINKL